MLLSKQLTFLSVITIKTINGKGINGKSLKNWVELCIFPTFLMIITSAVMIAFPNTYEERQAYTLYLIVFGLSVMDVMAYLLVSYIINSANEREARKLYDMQTQNVLEKYQQDMENMNILKEKNHEFKNHILCINALAKSKEYEKMTSYIENISGEYVRGQNVLDTGNSCVNVILNEKYMMAVEKGMLFSMNVGNLGQLTIDDKDVVVMLSNLINNACEACEKCVNKKYIELRCAIEGKEFILAVKNSKENKILYDEEKIVTDKNDPLGEHGIGIKNVVHVVEQNDGI